ncbi:MAG TPA: energy transducer TonB [Nitrospirota bacterium]|nr:energy transducer TonB [Nitrospirota bacterium]
MRPSRGYKIGQSGTELTQAVFFSFFLHAAAIVAVLVVYTAIGSRVYVPPFYNVKLVRLPSDQAPEVPRQAPPAQQPAPVQPKAIHAKPQPKPVLKQGAMPEYVQKKTKPAQQAEEKSEAPQAKPEVKPSGKALSVAVTSAPGESFNFPLTSLRDKIELNWNPPPGLKGAVSKVQFTVQRTGRVGEVKLIESSGNFYFDQAAIRAIMTASPLPMPEDFYRDYAVFTVDLMERD